MFSRLKKRFGNSNSLAKKHPETLRYEELEQRVLFSADVAPGLDPTAPVEQVLTEDLTADAPADHDAAAETANVVAAESRKELVFVNENVTDYQQLIDDLQANDTNRIIEVAVLESDRDGIEQVSEILAERSDLAAVHVIAHGSDGQISLGGSWLNSITLQGNSNAVAGWGDALTETGDILFYGCNVAADGDGQALLDNIATLTGADVAASDDNTGHASLSGDWELEYQRGEIETSVAISTAAQQNWAGTLQVETFQEGVNGYASTVDTYINEGSPASGYGNSTSLIADSTPSQQVLIRFDDIFGSGPNQIPPGSIINSASLDIYVTSSVNAGTVSLHSMLIDWGDIQSWNSIGSGIQVDGSDANATADSSISSSNTLYQTFTGLAATLQAWSDEPATNYGWVMEINKNGTWAASSSEGALNQPRLTVDFTPANTPPTIDLDADNSSGATGSDFATSWTEAGGAVAIVDASDATLTDTDDTHLESLTVTITNPADAPNEILGYDTTGTSIVGSYDTATGVLSLTGTDTVANYQTVLRTITYNNTSSVTDDTARTITFVAHDGSDNSNTATATVTINATNDAPFNTVPGNQSTAQDTDLIFSTGNGNAISVDDADAATVQVTLTATNGTASVNLTGVVESETQINTETGDIQDEPAIAVALDGSYVVAWASLNQDGDGNQGYGVFAQRYDANGNAVGSEIPVNFYTDNDQTNPSIAMDNDGNFVVAWQSKHEGTGYFNIYARRFSADGTAMDTNEFLVDQTGGADVINPDVAMNADGNFVIAFENHAPADSDGWGIYARRYDNTGTPQSAPFLVNTTNVVGNQHAPSVAMDDMGKFVVAWDGPVGAENQILFHRFDNDGSKLGGETPVTTTGYNYNARVDTDADGNFVVVWQNADSSSWGIGGRQYNADGTPVATEFRINTTETDDQVYPDVAVDSNGDFVVVWQSYSQDETNTYGVYGQRFDASGATVDNEFPVNITTAGTQNQPAVGIDDAGRFTVVWDGNGPGDATGIYTKNYNLPVSFNDGTGTDDATMTFSGSLADVNTALEGLTFTPKAGYTGPASVQILTSDLGSTGSGGTLTDDDTISITVNAVNDAPTFIVGDGVVSADLLSNDEFINGTTMQPDGKILVTGYVRNGSDYDFLLARYNTDGSLDSDFGTGGVVTTSTSSNAEFGYTVTVQTDGKIIVAGESFFGTYDIALIRYNSDGSLDTTFSDDGKLTTSVAVQDHAYSVLVQDDGKILVGGKTYLADNTYEFVVVRYDTNGTLDTTFSDDGKFTSPLDTTSQSKGFNMALQDDGKILLSGRISNIDNTFYKEIQLIRVDTDGTLDAAFGTGGVVTTDIGTSISEVFDIAVQDDGKILVTGSSYIDGSSDFVVVRYLSDGSLDTMFDGDGIVNIDIGTNSTDNARCIDVQSDGKILVGGHSVVGTKTDFALVRLNADGSLDTSFGGGDGKLTTFITANDDKVTGLNIQDDGMIVLSGYSNNDSSYDLALVRYNSDGTLDTDFALTNTLDGAPAYIEDGAVVVLDADVDVSDAELDALNGGAGNYAGASLTLVRNGGASADDVLGFNDGNGITLSGGNLIKNSQIIATFDTTTTPGELVITFTDGNGEIPTSANIDNILRQITYANSSDTPPASVQINWTFDDGNTGAQGAGGALTATGSTTVIITPANDAPTADAGGPYTISEGDGVALDASGSSDPNGDPLTYSWDLDNDGVFGEPGEPTGENPSVSWATLQSFGIDDDAANHTVGLRVDDGKGGTDTTTVDLTVQNTAPTLTVTGAASVDEGSTYTLNLGSSDPGNDTITSWTINWGDGTIDIVAGNPSSATHVYTLPGLTYNITVSATDEDGTYTDSNLLVASRQNDTFYLLDGTTGEVVTTLEATAALNGASEVVFGPDGNIYALSTNNDSVLKYDGSTGSYLGTFVTAGSGGLDNPQALTFGPDGHLYVGSYSTNEVLRYDGSTGAFIDAFIAAGTGGLAEPNALEFGQDGDLYVGSWVNHNVSRFDGQTGAFIEVVADVGASQFQTDFAFGPDGLLYVAHTTSAYEEIKVFDPATATEVNTIEVNGGPYAITFGPDGYLYASKWTGDKVEVWDTTTESLVRVFADSSIGLGNTWGIAFSPTVQVYVNDVNLAPTITSDGGGATASTDVVENTTAVTTVTATDGDGDTPTYTISGGADAAKFSINSTTGELSFIAAPDHGTPTDADTDNVYEVTVQASDGTLTDTQAISVTVTQGNQSPIITSNGGGSSANINVAENQTAVTTVTATDADGDTPTYTLVSGADQALFDIDSNTGVLTFKTAPDFENPTDANTDGTYEVVVLVTDGNGGSDTQTISVTVTNVNEGPDQYVQINENTVVAANVSAGDQDAPPYGIVGGADAALFQVSHDPIGKRFYLMFSALPNFESPADSDGDNVYEVTVNFDNVIYNYYVTVKDANDAPVGLPTISGTPTEDQTLTADPSGISDEDGLGGFSYQWLRDGSVISGATANTYTLGDDDVGAQISVEVSYTDGFGADETVTSAQTAAVANINDAPVLDNSGFLTLTIITEDDANNNGNLVSEIIASDGGDRITDADAGALEGIAILGLSSGNGTWEYDVGGGWTAVGSVSDTNSLLLQATDRLRFVPDGQNADTAFVTFAAWDQTTGTAGTKVDASTYGGTTAFSAAVETASITVTSVNDAPSGASASLFPSINEDNFNSFGKLVSAFTTTTSDPDSGAVKGIAIIEVDNSNGEWQYTLDGSNWFAVGNVSESSARLLAADATTRVRFVPDPDYNGTVFPFKIVAWDQTAGTAGGLADASVRGGTTAFSSPSTSVSIGVDEVNDSPTATGNAVSLASVSEDTADPTGATVTSLFGSVFSDAADEVTGGSTADALAGVAVVANTADAGAEGIWQWHNGTSWVDISTSVSISSALVLEPDTLVRFLPNIDYDGTPGSMIVRLIDDSSGAVTAGNTIDVTSSGGTTTYSDGSNAVTLHTSITPVNDAPSGLPVIIGTATEDQTLTPDTSGISDVDGLGAFSYQWLRDGVDIAGATDNTYTLGDADVGTQFSVRVDYTDGDGTAESLTSAQTAAVSNVNDAPVISVADTPILYLNGTLPIDLALTVTDVDDTMLESAQVWFGDGFQRGHDRLRFTNQLGITGSFSNSTGILTLTGTASVADYQTALRSVQYEDANPTPAQGILYVNFSVFDGTNTSNVETRVIEIVNNLPPRVGDDAFTVAEGSVNVLDVAANDTDSENSLDLTSIVIVTAPTNGNVIVNGDGTVTYTHNGSETTDDSFGYTIKDTDGNVSSEGFVFVTLTAVNDSPIVGTNTGTTVDEGSTGNVITTAILNEGDPDDTGAGLIYTLTGDVSNGTLRLNGTALNVLDTFTQADIDAGLVTYDHDDSETTTDSFDFSLADGGEDGATPATGTFGISVTPVNDNTPLINDLTTSIVEDAANTTLVTDLNETNTGNDTDLDGQALTYSITAGNSAGIFAIDANTGEITVADNTNLDYETTQQYVLTVEATDGTNTDTAAITIDVTDINESAVGPVSDNDGTANTVAEDAIVGSPVGVTALATDADGSDTVTYSLSDDAGGLFTIDSNTGVITVANALDYETATNHSVTVLATSSDASTSSQAFTINVTDVNESAVGLVTDSNAGANTVAENALVGDTVGITALATDADGSDTVTYSLSDDAGGLFTIDANTGVITVANALDYETATSHSVTVLATSSDTSTSSQAFTINVTDINESAVGPVTDSNAAANTVVENALVGDTVGITALASDADGTDTVTYSLSDDAGGLFTIDANTGVITVANALDYETATSHSVTVLATSSDASTSSQAFTINVTDVNESAVGLVTDSNAGANTVAENALVGDTVGITALATDADGSDTVTYSLSDDAGGLFTIDANTGVITVANALDYETATSHSVTVLATSSDTSTSSQAFTINVTDINESAVGPVTDSNAAADTVDENALVGATVGVTANAVDPDGGDTVSYSLDDDAGGLFTIDANNGVVTVAGALDAENAASQSITIRATSSDTSFSTTTLSIAVNDINEFAPVANDATVAINEDAANGTSVHNVVATDADATATLTYTITAGNADGVFAINATTGEITVANNTNLDRETTATYGLTVEVSDGTNSDTAAITVNVGDVDEFDVGAVTDANVAANTVAEDAVNGTAVGITALATDADATDNVTYSLSDDAGGRFAIDANTGVITVNGALDYETNTSHSVTVLATSDDGSTSSQAFTIDVTDVSEGAVGAISDTDGAADTVDENALVGATVGVTANAVDPDGGDTVSYSLDDDAGGLFTIDANNGVVTVAGALDAENAASHSITIRATSSDTSFSTTTLSIAVNDINEFSPVASDATVAINEDAANGTSVHSVVATDADATATLTYAITGGNADGVFTINATTGEITIADNTNLDRETTASYGLTVQVSDGTNTDTAAITVNVGDINEFVPVANDATVGINEDAANGTSVHSVIATDADATANLTYSITGGNADGIFTIDANTGEITIADNTNLDRETTATYGLNVEVSDGTNSDNAIITVNVGDINEFSPVANDATVAVNEDAANGTSVHSVIATDADATANLTYSITGGNADGVFTIDVNTGEITIADNTNLDRETTASYALTVEASDGTNTDTAAITINVGDVDEFDVGAVTDANVAANTVAEDAVNGTAVGITALATDADATDNVTYSLSDDAGGRFAIDANTGVITVNGALDYETNTSHSVTVLATSDDGSTSSQAFTIDVTDVSEGAVGAISDTDGAADTVDENALVGATVGVTANAVDPDGGDTVSYSLDDDAGGLFTIDANNGVVTVAGALDAENAASHSITIRATSSDTSFSTTTLSIAVNDINEFSPVASDATVAINEDTANGTSVHSVVATDADATATLTYAITGGNADGVFTINATTGEITIADNTNLDRETTASYGLTVQVSDGTNTDTAAITVNVGDINEFVPVANDATVGINEDAANGASVHTVVATDSDATANLTYSIIGGNADGVFTIDANTGEITIADNTNLDRETTASYALTVEASDGTNTDTAAITINVGDVDEFDVGAVTDSNVLANTVAEDAVNGTAVGITALATDADATDTVTYSLSDDAGGRFAIDANTGVITVNGALDYETNTSHSVTVLATSDDGSTSSQAFTIDVTDVSEGAVGAISDTDGAADTVDENALVGATVGVTANAVDPDGGDTVSYSLDDDAGGLFTIDANNGVVTVAGALDAENAASHSITIRATSSDTSFSTTTLSIAVNDINEFSPVASDATVAINEDTANGTSVHSVVATDADATATLTYAITGGNADGVFTINATTGEITIADNTNLDRETTASYGLTVQVSDGTNTDTAAITVNVGDINEFVPVANDATVGINEDAANGASVHTVVATDSDATANLTYSIIGGNADGVFTIDANTGEITIADNTNLDRETTASYALTVEASDGTNTDTAAITINVGDVDEFDVGAVTDSNVLANTVAEDAVNGTAVGITALATDADATDTVTYSLSDDAGGRFAIDANTGVITVNGALDYETNTSHSVTVLATSDDGSTSSQAFTIDVTDVSEGAVGAISDTDGAADTVDENALVGATVGVTANAVDPDGGDTVSYSLDDDAGGLFTIDANNGVVTVAGALDAENAASHSITIRATSSDTSFSTTTLSIAVNDINEFSPVASDATVAINEDTANGTSVHSVVATDADATATLTYAITGGNADGVFTINATTGEITIADNTNLDRETTASYGLTVQVSDGTNTDTAAITVNVGDINEFVPVANDATVGINEDAANGASVHTVVATDSDATANLTYSIIGGNADGVFTIDANTGEITIADNTNLDRETTASYGLTVEVSDGTNTDTAAITINVGDVDEFDVGPVTDSNFAANTVAEDAIVGITVGVTALADDADATDTVTYSLSDDAGGLFTIDSNTGIITVANALDYETATSHSVTVLATSSDTSTSSQAFTINVTDINESAVGPVTDSNGAANTVGEDAIVGTAVGVTALATDADGSDTVTYSLSDDAGGLFTIDANTGVITVANALDYETATSHSVTVLATSSDGSSSSTAFTITITNVNEAPSAVNNSFSGNEDTMIAGNVLANDSDVDGDSLTASLVSGPTHGSLTLNADGSFNYTPNANWNGTDSFTYRANDGVRNSNVATVAVTVIPVNDAPAVTSAAVTSATENAAYRYAITTTDPDSGASLTISAASLPPWLSLVDNGDGTATLSGTPTNTDVGTHNVVVTASDGALTDTQGFTITVAGTTTGSGPPVDDTDTDTDDDSDTGDPTDAAPGEDPPAEDDPEPITDEYLTVDYTSDPDESFVLMNDPQSGETQDIIYLTDENDADTRSETRKERRAYTYFDNDLYKEIAAEEHLHVKFKAPEVSVASDAFIDSGGTDIAYEAWERFVNNEDYDQLREEIDETFQSEQQAKAVKAKIVTASMTTFTVGIVSYFLRAGSMVASMVSTLPLWRGFDPIVIFSGKKKDKKGKEEAPNSPEQQSETLFDRDEQ